MTEALGPEGVVAILTAHEALGRSLRRALRFLTNRAVEWAPDLGALPPSEAWVGLVTYAGPDRGRNGTLSDFYLLRPVLLEEARTFRGPITVISPEDNMLGPGKVVPSEERVRLFSIPFEIADLARYIETAEPAADRVYTRLALRTQLTDADVKAIADGDTHGIRQLRPLSLALESALERGMRDAFTNPGPSVLRGRFFSTQAGAAHDLFVDLKARIEDAQYGGVSSCGERLDRMESTLAIARDAAELIDRRTHNETVPEAAWDDLKEELRRIVPESFHRHNQEWIQGWRFVCAKLLQR